MKLVYIAIFISTTIEKERVMKNIGSSLNTAVLINPTSAEAELLTSNNCLVVADDVAGATFATQNNLPYIQKWMERMESIDPAPVCYYDSIESLNEQYFINQWKRAHHLPLTIADTSRLILRELTLDDLPALLKIRNLDSVRKHLPAIGTLETELEKHKSYIKYQYEFFEYGLWGVFLKDGTLIGQAGIQNTEYLNETALELSYLIAPDFQRKGYATEAIIAIYHYAMTSLELTKLIAIIAKNNLPSIRTAMNLGMKRAESLMRYGFDCNYYVMVDIQDFMIRYQSEQKRVTAAKSAFSSALKHPVQEVYSKYHDK